MVRGCTSANAAVDDSKEVGEGTTLETNEIVRQVNQYSKDDVDIVVRYDMQMEFIVVDVSIYNHFEDLSIFVTNENDQPLCQGAMQPKYFQRASCTFPTPSDLKDGGNYIDVTVLQSADDAFMYKERHYFFYLGNGISASQKFGFVETAKILLYENHPLTAASILGLAALAPFTFWHYHYHGQHTEATDSSPSGDSNVGSFPPSNPFFHSKLSTSWGSFLSSYSTPAPPIPYSSSLAGSIITPLICQSKPQLLCNLLQWIVHRPQRLLTNAAQTLRLPAPIPTSVASVSTVDMNPIRSTPIQPTHEHDSPISISMHSLSQISRESNKAVSCSNQGWSSKATLPPLSTAHSEEFAPSARVVAAHEVFSARSASPSMQSKSNESFTVLSLSLLKPVGEVGQTFQQSMQTENATEPTLLSEPHQQVEVDKLLKSQQTQPDAKENVYSRKLKSNRILKSSVANKPVSRKQRKSRPLPLSSTYNASTPLRPVTKANWSWLFRRMVMTAGVVLLFTQSPHLLGDQWPATLKSTGLPNWLSSLPEQLEQLKQRLLTPNHQGSQEDDLISRVLAFGMVPVRAVASTDHEHEPIRPVHQLAKSTRNLRDGLKNLWSSVTSSATGTSTGRMVVNAAALPLSTSDSRLLQEMDRRLLQRRQQKEQQQQQSSRSNVAYVALDAKPFQVLPGRQISQLVAQHIPSSSSSSSPQVKKSCTSSSAARSSQKQPLRLVSRAVSMILGQDTVTALYWPTFLQPWAPKKIDHQAKKKENPRPGKKTKDLEKVTSSVEMEAEDEDLYAVFRKRPTHIVYDETFASNIPGITYDDD